MATAHSVSNELVLKALGTVNDPDLKQDLVTLGMIRDLAVTPDGAVSFRVVLTTPACPLKEQIQNEARNAVSAVAGVISVDIKMDAEVRTRTPGATSQAGLSIKGVTHIIAVSSGKGGVGKSTVAANLAASLKLDGARVGLMDADVYGPNIPTMMGVIAEPKITQDPERGEIFLPPTSHGIPVMSMGFLTPGDQPLVWRGPMLHSVVNQFCHKVEWGTLDYLVVDMPPGTGDVQLSLAQLVPVSGAVLVTTPQEVSLQDVRKAYNMFEKVRVPVVGIVENMSYFVCDGCDKRHFPLGQGGGVLLAKKYKTTCLAQLPMVPAVREAGDEGTPIVIADPQSPVAQEFRAMARKIAQQVSIRAAQVAAIAPGVTIGSFS